jgi:hypothetical protein
MEMIISYSNQQLEAAVEFVCKNNLHFVEEQKYVRTHILKCMENLAKDPDATYLATMGFILISDVDTESMDNNENICHIDIYVDPNLKNNKYEFKQFTINL